MGLLIIFLSVSGYNFLMVDPIEVADRTPFRFFNELFERLLSLSALIYLPRLSDEIYFSWLIFSNLSNIFLSRDCTLDNLEILSSV